MDTIVERKDFFSDKNPASDKDRRSAPELSEIADSNTNTFLIVLGWMFGFLKILQSLKTLLPLIILNPTRC
jgi:hypothetical protein